MKSTFPITILSLFSFTLASGTKAAMVVPTPGNPTIHWGTPIVEASPGSLAKAAGNRADSEARWGKSVFISKPFIITSTFPPGTYYQLRAYHEVYARPRFEGLASGMDAMVEIAKYPRLEPDGGPEEGYVFHDLSVGASDHQGTDLISLETGKTYYMKVFSTVPEKRAFKEHYTGALIQLAEPEPLSADFVADSLTWDPKKGMEYQLRVAGAEGFKQIPPAEALAGLYWAKGPTLSDVLEGDPIVTTTLAIGYPPSKNPVTGTIGTAFLNNQPVAATHLVLVADVGNRFVEAVENNNVFSIPIPPDFIAEHLEFDGDTGGLKYKFSVTGLELFRASPKEVTWTLSFKTGTHKGPAFLTKIIQLGNELSELELSGLITPDQWKRFLPFNATQLVLEIDPENRIAEIDETNNTFVYGVPPWLIFQPAIRPSGPDVRFSVVAHGTPPLRYQWLKDGQPLLGANTELFLIRNVQPDASGIYTVRVDNDYGWTISSNAYLNVMLHTNTLALSAMPSSGGKVTGAGSFPTGTSQTVTATASDGYAFVNWTENGSVVSTSASYTFTLSTNRTLVAHFSPNPVSYTLTVSASPRPGGKVSGGGTFAQGTSAIVTAVPGSGYSFVHWTENGAVVSTSASYSVTLNSDRTLVAHFILRAQGVPEVRYVVTVSASPSAGGKVSGEGTFPQGTSATVTAIANRGYLFANWTENGIVVGSSPDYTFTLNKRRTLIANFVKTPTGPDVASRNQILLQDSGGFIGAWLMDRANLQSAGLFDPSNPGDGWHVCGLGDFDGDGNEDILFQHNDGSLAVWFLDSFKMKSASLLAARTDSAWQAVAVKDFDLDGKVDIVLQHSDGSLAAWLMDGIELKQGVYFEPRSPSDVRWTVSGSGDLDGDGSPDLVFQHQDGTIAIWFLDGVRMNRASLTNPRTTGGWRVSGVTDLNRDGKADLLLQNFRTAELAVWYMNGADLVQGQLLRPSKTEGTWQIVAPR